MPPKFKFQEGEKVLCFHGPLIYEAKCLESEVKDKEIRYYIHYAGWNKSWDEWVPENRILKFNDQNVIKQKEVQKAQKSNAQKIKKAALGKAPKSDDTRSESDSGDSSQLEEKPETSKRTMPSHDSPSSDNTRKKRIKMDVPGPTVNPRTEITITIPEGLKPILVKDWNFVSENHKLVNLPATVCVDKILEDYKTHKTSDSANTPNKESAVIELTQGVKAYFNVMLGTQLLYNFERPQYEKIKLEHGDKPMSELYGFIHLLRLFVKLGGMMSYTPLDKKSVNILVFHIHSFLKYIDENQSTLFLREDYVTPPEGYKA